MLAKISAVAALWGFSAAALGHAQSYVVGGDASIVAMEGTPVGTEQVYNNVTMYVTMPDASAPVTNTAVLYLTDAFGINLTENRLLADSFARAGFITVAPDLFQGQAAPSDLNNPNFNATAFLATHNPNVTDPVIDTTITFLRQSGQFNFTKLAVTGYCFGGRYAFRFTDPARTLKADVAFTAHPSAWTEEDIRAIGAPTSIAAADNDQLMSSALRAELEALMLNGSSPYQVTLYGGTLHGFGVRVNLTDPLQVFGKQSAFLQAVRWFNYF